jgi:CRISPR-associated endonuclease/helicase Cas3
MSLVIPLADCLARPDQSLVDHLEAVADRCGDRAGSFEDRLAYLAGLSHDAAKAAADWQSYIRGGSKKGPPHAPAGAAIFAFWAEDLLPKWVVPKSACMKELRDLCLDWIRVVDGHHGSFDDLEFCPPWMTGAYAPRHFPECLIETCDRAGLDSLLRKHFPESTAELADFKLQSQTFSKKIWERAAFRERPDIYEQAKDDRREDRIALRIAELASRLIYADRSHAADWKPDRFRSRKAESAIESFALHIQKEEQFAREKQSGQALVRARAAGQAEALASFLANPDQKIFTLLLPTGYGKTLAGLRVALEAVRGEKARRIIYVAPYISILSQAAAAIEKAIGLPVVVHHQSSILTLGDGESSEKSPLNETAAEDHQPYDLLDTWQAPVVATTFNQLFRSLFPYKASECLRIKALENAFVFIDEPQIIDSRVWSAFLKASIVAAREKNARFLFCTATLPPIENAIDSHNPPIPLVEPRTIAVSRFQIRSTAEPWNLDRTVCEAEAKIQSRRSVAVILNTVKDALDVYQKLAANSSGVWFFLASRMLPGHKEKRIEAIKKRLSDANKTVGVVCTQVLEAGVDLSFRTILRACPIFPSIVQTAGRANRHAEGDPAEVLVFPYVRDDGKPSRRFVYREKFATDLTDQILRDHPSIDEAEVSSLMDHYYKTCWKHNSHTTCLDAFQRAALGKWSEISGIEPFGDDYPGIDVFVPGGEKYLPERYKKWMRKFRVDTAEQLLDRYLDRLARRELSFNQKRAQSALLRMFLVDFPRAKAAEIAHPAANDRGSEWPYVLNKRGLYHKETGLAHLLTEELERASITKSMVI